MIFFSACGCDSLGSKGVSCDDGGVCNCKKDFVGMKCDTCAPDRYNYPLCKECNCDPAGSNSTSCNKETGQCHCYENFGGLKCDSCAEGFYDYPLCNGPPSK